jgi:carboxylesterase type B
VFALLASPSVSRSGLVHGGISLSGSPRLNSTTEEAASYWHKQVVKQTRCDNFTSNHSKLVSCLLSLNETEIVSSTPANWHTDGFGFSIFSEGFQYAPILLIDSCILPNSYFNAYNKQNKTKALPLIIGATRQESDFSPQDDVRNFSVSEFKEFILEKLSAYNSSFVNELFAIYVEGNQSEPFNSQRLYSDIVTDSTILCPNAYLASRWVHTGNETPVYFYSVRQRTEKPFCVLEPFNSFSPPYCPLYSFHASDMFMWLAPGFDTNEFNYRMTSQDLAFGSQLQSRFAEFATMGKVAKWQPFSLAQDFLVDRLPQQFHTIDMALPDSVVPNYRAHKCNFWLKHKFYEQKGLIN